jgi:hypothetical protein
MRRFVLTDFGGWPGIDPRGRPGIFGSEDIRLMSESVFAFNRYPPGAGLFRTAVRFTGGGVIVVRT